MAGAIIAHDPDGFPVIALDDDGIYALECGGTVVVDLPVGDGTVLPVTVVYQSPKLIEPGREQP